MRSIRTLVIGGTLCACAAATASAQMPRDQRFTDSWFWGSKGGGMVYGKPGVNSTAGEYGLAGSVGVEWLITRTRGGLYLSLSQVFLDPSTLIPAGPPPDTGWRRVEMKNLRRVDVAMMAFPGGNLTWHPYAGIGFALNNVATTMVFGTYRNARQEEYAAATVQQMKAVITPVIMGGVQYRLPVVSAFVQGSVTPTERAYLLYAGKSLTTLLELGIRYNVGSSIDGGK